MYVCPDSRNNISVGDYVFPLSQKLTPVLENKFMF